MIVLIKEILILKKNNNNKKKHIKTQMININHTLMIKINNQKKKMNYLMLIMKKKILEKYMKIILMILIENL